jgi:hypothetical protein
VGLNGVGPGDGVWSCQPGVGTEFMSQSVSAGHRASEIDDDAYY